MEVNESSAAKKSRVSSDADVPMERFFGIFQTGGNRAFRAGKTEYAKSLFQRPLELKISSLEFFSDTMRQFGRGGAGHLRRVTPWS